MADKKSIIIKIKRPSLRPDHEIQGVVMTQWHLPRIVMAAALLLVVLAGLLYLVLHGLGDAGRQAAQHPSVKARPAVGLGSEHQPGIGDTKINDTHPVLAGPPVKADGRVRRALLVSSIVGKEPGRQLPGIIHASNKQPTTVYYFTELRNMDGQTVYHVWSHDGKIIDRHPQHIAAVRWRTSSQRQITSKSVGHWQVKTTDSQGRLLNALSFEVK